MEFTTRDIEITKLRISGDRFDYYPFLELQQTELKKAQEINYISLKIRSLLHLWQIWIAGHLPQSTLTGKVLKQKDQIPHILY